MKLHAKKLYKKIVRTYYVVQAGKARKRMMNK